MGSQDPNPAWLFPRGAEHLGQLWAGTHGCSRLAWRLRGGKVSSALAVEPAFWPPHQAPGVASGSCSAWHRAPPFSSLGPFPGLSSPSSVALMTQPRWRVVQRKYSREMSPCYRPGPQVCAVALPGGLMSCPSPPVVRQDLESCVHCVPVCGVCNCTLTTTVCDCAHNWVCHSMVVCL